MLEQSVNSGVLSLMAGTFASSHGPLDAFILHAVTSSGQSGSTEEQVDRLDSHHDMMFNVGHLATLCTPDQKFAQKIKR